MSSFTARGRRRAARGFAVVVDRGGKHIAAMRTVTCCLMLLATLPIFAEQRATPGDFDYLLGDWEFTAASKKWGTFDGYWSAVRLDEGQIVDEYRVVDDDKTTVYVTTTFRNYNKRADRWEIIGADAGGGLQDFGTARRSGAEMHIEQKVGVGTDEPSLWRIRYYDIQADRFRWAADRSTDGGKTWVKNYLTIEARRIGPPRSIGALAPPR